MSKKRYGAEFKKEATRLIIIDGMSVAKSSEKLGVSAAQLYKWRDAHLEAFSGEAAKDAQASPKVLAAELDRVRKELRKAERINEILKKNGGLLQQERDMKFRFIEDNRDRFGVAEMREALGAPKSGYYRWEKSAPSARDEEDEVLKEAILRIPARQRETTAIERSMSTCSTKGFPAAGIERSD